MIKLLYEALKLGESGQVEDFGTRDIEWNVDERSGTEAYQIHTEYHRWL